jgi:flagellar protein FlgJ
MKPADFFNTYAPLAQGACQGTGLLASVALAQAAIESGWGESVLTKKYNNFGGIKAAWDWTGKTAVFNTREVIGGKDVVVKAAFRAYDSPAHYFRARVDFLRANRRYRALFAADDYISEAKSFQAAGYATDPHYAATLIGVVAKYDLTKYDAVPGIVSAQVARELFAVPAKAIQVALLGLGFNLGPTGADGAIGRLTRDAINNAQPEKLLAIV